MTLNHGENGILLSPPDKSDTDKSLCPVCLSPSLCSCRTCKKISYCGKAHQRRHWKQHKSECYPLILQEDEFLGCRLIATRNIKKGEVILRENALVSGPNLRNTNPTEDQDTITDNPATSKMCLGCFNIVKSDYLCTTCSWPVCGPRCEKSIQHLENECKIFASCKLLPFPVSLRQESMYKYYEAITVLRGILLKENDPIKWQKIKDLERKLDEKRLLQTRTRVQDLTQFCNTFIQDQCSLSHITQEDIDSVLMVLSTEAFGVYEDVNTCRNGLHLYHIASFADQNCTPNSAWRIQANFEIYLRALIAISFGERVSISHTDVTQGTTVRQKLLQRYKSYNCVCERCTNRTELGTLFSAIKCPSCHSSDGYLIQTAKTLLPMDPGSRIPEWSCNECGEKKDLDFYQDILASFKKDMSSILPGKDAVEHFLMLEQKLSQHLCIALHPNHFEVYKIEMLILKLISTELDGNHWPHVDEMFANLIEKFITLSQKWLTVADVLWPGYSEPRGFLLNCLQRGLMMNLIIVISMNMKKKETILKEAATEKQLQKEFMNILQIRKEILEIFCFDLEGSTGRKIAESMAQECPEIKILRKRFHCILTKD